MRVISIDTETHLLKRGLGAPKLVCLTFAARVAEGEVYAFPEGFANDTFLARGPDAGKEAHIFSGLLLYDHALAQARTWLLDDEVILLGHNLFYDLGIIAASDPSLLPLIFRKIELGLVRDTQLRMQLLDIATGDLKFYTDEETGEVSKSSYHLSDLSRRLLRKFLKKKDTWRLKYALLDGVPIEQWPEDAKRYAIDDAITTLQVYEEQETLAGAEIPNSAEQHRAAWALHLMSLWGVRTDGEAVAKLKAELEIDYAALMEKLRPVSEIVDGEPTDFIYKKKEKGIWKEAKSMKAIRARISLAFERLGKDCPHTDSSDKFPDGQIATDRKTLLATGDPDLKNLSEVGAIGKLLNTYIPVLESGTRFPINPRYHVLVETGRTSCSKPNIQNPPRKGGVRECFIPRDGCVYVFCDYDTLELRSLAQVCLDMLGFSDMAEAIRRGEDLHLSLAAEMLGISYEEAKDRHQKGDAEVIEYRQQSKPANFGYPGGMAAESFREYAEQYNIQLTSERAKEIRDTWFSKWSEMRPYFEWISSLVDSGQPIQQIRSGRIRGGAFFCAVANGMFQGLASDMCKEALWRVAVESYVDAESPLYGCRPVIFLHDELCLEVPYESFGKERSSRAADRLAAVMIESAAYWIPDVPITCKPVMTRRWFKGAESKREGGLLVPVKPVTMDNAGKKKTVWVKDEQN